MWFERGQFKKLSAFLGCVMKNKILTIRKFKEYRMTDKNIWWCIKKYAKKKQVEF